MSAPLTRNSPFAYQCGACGQCCHDKKIQTNPYEVLRLARNRGLSTGAFIARHMEAEGPFLQVRETGACVFLEGTGCSVHTDRPLVCRTYPLGRSVAADGVERFGGIEPHPASAGSSRGAGTVADYLARQRVDDFVAAADRLQALFYRLFDALAAAPPGAGAAPSAVTVAAVEPAVAGEPDRPLYAEWFDVDDVVARYCDCTGRAVPEHAGDVFETYLEAMGYWLANTQET
ncbi:MAG: YkgJ family cysteine cluster protein [Hyphomicrobiaceae bacterium]